MRAPAPVRAHGRVFNTRGAGAAGCHSADRLLPSGGVIGREDGTLTGYMEENAFLEYQKRGSHAGSGGTCWTAYRKAQDLYASYGITTVQEGLLRRELVPLYQALLADGSGLELDVVAYGRCRRQRRRPGRPFRKASGDITGRFKLGGYKMFLDGSPQGRYRLAAAALRRGRQAYRGYGTLTDAAGAGRWSADAGTDGMQLLAHCNGDAACAQYLAALDAGGAGRRRNSAALRPVMIHAQLLGRDQLPEVRRLGVIPSFFVAHVYHWGDVHLENLGPGRAEAISPAGSAAETGDPLHIPSGCAGDPARYAGDGVVCREPGDPAGPRPGPGRAGWTSGRPSEAVTVHAAYQYFEETDKGTLAPGKQADLVILDRDPLAVPQEELRDIRVLETWKDGVPIFCREA